MALRRHGLAQRRKAVGLTQESLAQRLGVERSTVVRWEAGDTEPLPSIRPTMARALDVSVDQLAELLTEPENAEIPVGTEVTIPVPLPEVRPGRAGFEDLIRPQVAETIEALRRVLRSAGVAAADLDAMLLVGGSSRVLPGSAEPSRPVTVDADPQAAIGLGAALSALSGRPADNARPADIDIDTASADVEPDDVQRRRARSRRFTRFAAAGVLVLVLAEGAASVPFTTSRSGPIPPIAAGTPAPVAAIPAPDIPAPGPPSNDSTGAVPLEPAAAPDTPADGLATPGAAAVPTPHTTRTTSKRRTTSRSRPPAATAPQPPRTPAIPAEAYAWAHQAGLSASDHRRTRPRPAHRPRP
ncbi:MAG: helix-turn-helix domain-containing protein [Pseudonocardiaceae bacterium]